jgi:protein phosphatase 2C family protein 2/3
VKENVLQYILDDVAFPTAIEDAVKSAFLRLDDAFAKACSVDHDLSSGTTALTALLSGRNLLVANAGDCRAVLCRRGKAVEMSRDHKPECLKEKLRIEKVGGYVDDGYLNGQLAVARAIGDWHMTGLKEQGVEGPLSAEPEMQHEVLTEDDEFLVIGCDGLWDVFTSQNAVDLARKELQQHNDPERCSRELVTEALKRSSCDNLTVVTVCFKMEPPPRLGSAWRPRVRRSFSAEGISSLQGFLNECPPIEGLCDL